MSYFCFGTDNEMNGRFGDIKIYQESAKQEDSEGNWRFGPQKLILLPWGKQAKVIGNVILGNGAPKFILSPREMQNEEMGIAI